MTGILIACGCTYVVGTKMNRQAVRRLARGRLNRLSRVMRRRGVARDDSGASRASRAVRGGEHGGRRHSHTAAAFPRRQRARHSSRHAGGDGLRRSARRRPARSALHQSCGSWRFSCSQLHRRARGSCAAGCSERILRPHGSSHRTYCLTRRCRLAPPPPDFEPLHIGSYNIHRCVGTDGRCDVNRVARSFAKWTATRSACRRWTADPASAATPSNSNILATATGMQARRRLHDH